MPDVEIYTTPFCPFCLRAKHLLEKKGAAFSEVNLMTNPDRRQEMIERANGDYTVPQIFIDGHHIGGCDELYELEIAGKLEPLLEAEAKS